MIGVPRNKVVLSEYNSDWVALFEEEKQRLLSVCEDKIKTIEHVGSTSIPGLIAKPLIDIALTFENWESGNALIEPIVSLNYEFIAGAGVADRLLFVKRVDGDSYYHIHAYSQGSTNYKNQILFRDYLRNHKEIAEEYAQLKKNLYEEYKDNRPRYTEGKEKFIIGLLRIINDKY